MLEARAYPWKLQGKLQVGVYFNLLTGPTDQLCEDSGVGPPRSFRAVFN